MKRNASAKAVLASLFVFTISTHAWAGLTWEKPKNEFTAHVGAELARTGYCFTNTGKTTVSILNVQPSCGCVTTSLQKFTYAPGEGGEIKVTFDLGMDEFAKLQKRRITVTTSDAPKSPKILKLIVHVPEAVSATPGVMIWKRGEKPKAKEAVIRAGPDVAPIRLVQTTANDNFVVEVKPEVEGKRYRLKITPVKTDALSYAELKFNVESASFKNRVSCEVHLDVR